MEHKLLNVSAALIQAVALADLELVVSLLNSGADVNEAPHSWALVEAVLFENLEILHCLIEHGANAQEKARALQAASRYDYREAARLLIEYGADINADPLPFEFGTFNGNRTALQAAAGTGNTELVKLLLHAGAEVESLSICPNEQGTALQFAAIAGSIAVVDELVQRGANVNARAFGDNRRTALEGAAEHERLDMVQLLLNLEAEIQGSRAWCFAKHEGDEGVVALLLENGFEDIGTGGLSSGGRGSSYQLR